MATYAIGDVQGCYNQLEKLLSKINFDKNKDTLWFAGDVVNRGPNSLEVLRYIKSLGSRAQLVLGNHDLHLLAVFFNAHPIRKEDSFGDILEAPDVNDLMNWLVKMPLIMHDERLGYTLVHAGFAPGWDLKTALSLSKEVETVIQDDKKRLSFFREMYGDEPARWHPELKGNDRLRCIVNYFTRSRFLNDEGSLILHETGSTAAHLTPWFKFEKRASQSLKIIFGHWAALGGVTGISNVYALDTGCVWGYRLTAMRLEDEMLFSVDCHFFSNRIKS